MRTIPDVAGARVDIVYTNCDTLVKDEAIRVYMSRAEAKDEPFLKKWLNRKELIFEYDPAGGQQPPAVQASEGGKVVISVTNVSQIFTQRREWEGVGIDYKIGQVAQP